MAEHNRSFSSIQEGVEVRVGVGGGSTLLHTVIPGPKLMGASHFKHVTARVILSADIYSVHTGRREGREHTPASELPGSGIGAHRCHSYSVCDT